MSDHTIHLGDCREVMRTLESESIDAIVTDPPYACVDRPYGRLTEAEWHDLMRAVVAESRRVLKPRGSAVFILQPNSERVGRMRPWLWEFMAWTAREWNQVQDAWWWNYATTPCGGATTGGLLRGSLKAAVWLGDPDCWRDQDAVLWAESSGNEAHRLYHRGLHRSEPSGHSCDYDRHAGAAVRRGGTTPFNVIPCPGADWKQSREASGHPGKTPLVVADWWVRYISPPGSLILDPFMGSGTTGLAALRRHRRFIGIERMPEYVEIAKRRLDGPPMPLFDEPDAESVEPADPAPLLALMEAVP